MFLVQSVTSCQTSAGPVCKSLFASIPKLPVTISLSLLATKAFLGKQVLAFQSSSLFLLLIHRLNDSFRSFATQEPLVELLGCVIEVHDLKKRLVRKGNASFYPQAVVGSESQRKFVVAKWGCGQTLTPSGWAWVWLGLLNMLLSIVHRGLCSGAE